jgi:biotin carboxylase
MFIFRNFLGISSLRKQKNYLVGLIGLGAVSCSLGEKNNEMKICNEKDSVIFHELSVFGYDKLLGACLKNDLQPILFTSNTNRFPLEFLDKICVVDIDTKNKEACIEYISKNLNPTKVKGIINALDYTSLVGGEVASHFGWISNSIETLSIIRNKDQVRRKLDENKIRNVRSQKISTDNGIEELYSFFNLCNKKIILKNAGGTGSEDIHIISADCDIERIGKEHVLDPKKSWVVEEYISGVLYSAEFISYKGKHQFLGITNRLISKQPYFQELGLSFPANFPEAVNVKVDKYISSVLDAVNFEYGFSHTEFMLEKGEPILIEINPRIGGLCIGVMMSEALGINVYEKVLLSAIGENPFLEKIEYKKGGAVSSIHAESEGKIKSISGINEINNYTDSEYISIKKPGDLIAKVGDCTSRCGVVICFDLNSQLAIDKVNAISNNIIVEVEEKYVELKNIKEEKGIIYKLGRGNISIDEIINLYEKSGIIRPTKDYERIEEIYLNSNIVVSAWDGKNLVGIGRALSDKRYATYLADLAVSLEYQKRGIGTQIIEIYNELIAEESMLLLLSSKPAMIYYEKISPQVGFEKVDNGFIIKRKK